MVGPYLEAYRQVALGHARSVDIMNTNQSIGGEPLDGKSNHDEVPEEPASGPTQEKKRNISRRSFLKWTAALTGGVALAGVGIALGQPTKAEAANQAVPGLATQYENSKIDETSETFRSFSAIEKFLMDLRNEAKGLKVEGPLGILSQRESIKGKLSIELVLSKNGQKAEIVKFGKTFGSQDLKISGTETTIRSRFSFSNQEKSDEETAEQAIDSILEDLNRLKQSEDIILQDADVKYSISISDRGVPRTIESILNGVYSVDTRTPEEIESQSGDNKPLNKSPHIKIRFVIGLPGQPTATVEWFDKPNPESIYHIEPEGLLDTQADKRDFLESFRNILSVEKADRLRSALGLTN